MISHVEHATLFALIAQEILSEPGVNGEQLVSDAVRLYGERRGGRMAEKARRYGFDNDLTGYLLFGEVDLSGAGNIIRITQKRPHMEICVEKCSWNSTWGTQKTLHLGALYCKDIDNSIMRGFNRQVGFTVSGVLTEGSDCCRFSWPGWPLKPRHMLAYLRHKKKLSKISQKPWDYHVADLYNAFSAVLTRRSGEAGKDALLKAMLQFTGQFGLNKRDIIVELAETTDFERVD